MKVDKNKSSNKKKRANYSDLAVKGLALVLKDFDNNTLGHKWISEAIRELNLQSEALNKVSSAMVRNLTAANKIAMANEALCDYDEAHCLTDTSPHS